MHAVRPQLRSRPLSRQVSQPACRIVLFSTASTVSTDKSCGHPTPRPRQPTVLTPGCLRAGPCARPYASPAGWSGAKRPAMPWLGGMTSMTTKCTIRCSRRPRASSAGQRSGRRRSRQTGPARAVADGVLWLCWLGFSEGSGVLARAGACCTAGGALCCVQLICCLVLSWATTGTC